MATLNTRIVVAARPKASRNDARFGFGETYDQTTEGYGQIEIVEVTTTTKERAGGGVLLRSDEKRVLLTLSSADAQHLLATLGRALVDSLDARPEVSRPSVGITITSEA